MRTSPIKIIKMIKKINGKWVKIESDAINNSDDIDGLILVTVDNRKFKLTEILKDGKY